MLLVGVPSHLVNPDEKNYEVRQGSRENGVPKNANHKQSKERRAPDGDAWRRRDFSSPPILNYLWCLSQ